MDCDNQLKQCNASTLVSIPVTTSSSLKLSGSLKLEKLPVPGFVDLQVNGYLGVDFCSLELTEEKFLRASRALLADTGTVGFLPTVITASVEEYEHVLPIIAKCIAQDEFFGRILGIHLEGPFISAKHGAVGAHRPHLTRKPDLTFLQRLIELSNDNIRLITIAAELEGAADLCRWCCSRPKLNPEKQAIIVSLGHQLATSAQLNHLAAAGAVMLTHLGNGMPNMVHRHHNTLIAGLANDALSAGIIADGFHLPDDVLRIMIRCKGFDKLVLVSDMAPICGCAPGTYNCLGTKVKLEQNFCVSEVGKNNLAGSGSTLLRCANVLMNRLQLSLDEIAKLAFENPLKILGIPANHFVTLTEQNNPAAVVLNRVSNTLSLSSQIPFNEINASSDPLNDT